MMSQLKVDKITLNRFKEYKNIDEELNFIENVSKQLVYLQDEDFYNIFERYELTLKEMLGMLGIYLEKIDKEIQKNEKYIEIYCDSYVDFNGTFFSNIMVEGMLDVDLLTDSTPKAPSKGYYELLLQSVVYGRREYLLRLQKMVFDAGDVIFYQLSEEDQKEFM